MSILSAVSKNGIQVRLTSERWTHIVDEHSELAAMQLEVVRAVSDPNRVVAGGGGELLAVREIARDKWLVVVYREMEHDGFIITAFITRRIRPLLNRQQLWP